MKRYKDAYDLENPLRKKIEDLGDQVKYVCDNSPRVRTQGAKRLMTSTAMTHTVNQPSGIEAAEIYKQLQKAARDIWWTSGVVARKPIEEDGVFSGLLFDEIHLQVNKTEDLLRFFNDGVKKRKETEKDYEPPLAAKRRIEKLAQKTPYTINVINPMTAYPEWDRIGLRRYYSERKVTMGYIKDNYGIACEDEFKEVTLCDMWDLEYRTIWIKGKGDEEDEILVQEPHKLPEIPIACSLVEGSDVLWDKPEDQAQPFLYTLLESGLWDLNTILLSVMATNTLVFGAIANFIYKGDESPKYKKEEAIGYYHVGLDESLEPLEIPYPAKSLQEMFGLALQMTTEATIYDQSLGAPGGSGDPYSKTALLHQAGRLPLVTIQRQMGMVAAKAMEIVFEWMRHDEGEYTTYGQYGENIFDSEDIPEYIMIKSNLEIDLPQDQLQMANIATALRELMGDEWVMKRVLSENEPDSVIEERDGERVAQAHLELKMQRMAQQQQLEFQEMAAQQAQARQMAEQMQQFEMAQAAQGQQELPPGMEAAQAQAEGQGIQPPVPNRAGPGNPEGI